MATSVNEILENPSIFSGGVLDRNLETSVAEELPNHGGQDSQLMFSEEEVRDALEKSASTGMFWLEWEKLRSIMSFHLKQFLSEYPEATMTSEQQTSSLGVTFQELVEKLDNALHRFDEGPPFTLQRLCEILLYGRSIYPKMSKLSLALEKNLAVTSTLSICTEPYRLPTVQDSNGTYEESGPGAQPEPTTVENRVELSVADKDVIMAEVQESEVGEAMTMDIETIDDIVRSTEANPTPAVESKETIIS